MFCWAVIFGEAAASVVSCTSPELSSFTQEGWEAGAAWSRQILGLDMHLRDSLDAVKWKCYFQP